MRRTRQLVSGSSLPGWRGWAPLIVAGTLSLAGGLVVRPLQAADVAGVQSKLGEGRTLTRDREYDKAIALLAGAGRDCREIPCSLATRSEIYLALAYAHGLKREADEARKYFEWALALDASAIADEAYATRAIRRIFDDASARVASGQGAVPPQTRHALSQAQQKAVDTARKQLASGDWEACLQTMLVATSLDEFAAGRLMLARCQGSSGLLLEAGHDAALALERATESGDEKLRKEIESYLQLLDEETPKIRLRIQRGIRKPVVKIDDMVVAPGAVKALIPHNPGMAVVEVTGQRGGQPYAFRQEIRFQRGETIELEVRSDVTPYQACLNTARTLKEREACDVSFGQGQATTYTAALEVSSYNDNDHVDVLSPALSLAVVQPTEGWSLGGAAIVDVLTTASADIVATASRRFDDTRVAGSVGGSYKVGPVTPRLSASMSIESDYVGRRVGAEVSGELFDKTLTPYLAYGLGFDILGRADTPFEVFSRNITTHAIQFGTSVVINASTVGVLGATIQLEDGDTSKPYRYVPMFFPTVAEGIPRGASPELVAAARIDTMPLEQLPVTRQRYALLARGAHRLETSTLRASERLYVDSWGQLASSTDARFIWDFHQPEESGGLPRLTLAPHARFHIQGPVAFWERSYVGLPTAAGVELPLLRAGDRELGPLLSVSLGSEFRAALAEGLTLGVQVEGIYTQFLDHLYVFDRWGLFTASTIEVEIN